MRNFEKHLIVPALDYDEATTQLEEFMALWELREVLAERAMLTILSIDGTLQEFERSLLEVDKDAMRQLGYCFPEDLENAKEMLSNPEDSDAW